MKDALLVQIKINSQINNKVHGIHTLQGVKDGRKKGTVTMEKHSIEGKIEAIVKYYRFHDLKFKSLHLNLAETHMDDELLKELLDEIQKYSLEIESLNLSKNAIGDKGCQYLADLLSKNYKIHKLDLS